MSPWSSSMCRLLGIISSKNRPIGILYQTICEVLRRLCYEKHKCHGDGYGIAWIEENGWHLEKGTDPFWRSPKLRQLVKRIRSRVYLLHARKSTFPLNCPLGLRKENNHPYILEINGSTYVFAHNGHIIFDESKLRCDHNNKLLRFYDHTEKLTSYGTDSEIFFRLLAYFFRMWGGREPEDMINALKDTLRSGIIKEYTAINFIMGGRKYFYALRLYYKEEDAERYTLYYTYIQTNKPQERLTTIYISSEPLTNSTPQSKRKTNEHHLDWKIMKNGELIYIPIEKPSKIATTKLQV